MSGTIKSWPKSIEIVREGNEQQEGTILEHLNREEKVNLIKIKEHRSLHNLLFPHTSPIVRTKKS